jgi:hypothetical protein
MVRPSAEDVERFYRAAMVGLGALETRSGGGRRFGPDADARWKAFRGSLEAWDRIELLVRDAAVGQPEAFAPRVVFDLPALTDDEPFGADWPGPAPEHAAGWLRTAAESSKRDLGATLREVATIWGLAPQPLPPDALRDLAPATRLVVSGSGAVASVAAAFSGRPELDLADQVLLVADDPGTRQLFGLALVLLGSRTRARIVRSDVTAEHLAAGFAHAHWALVSEDLTAEVRGRVDALAHALGAARREGL